MKNKNYIVVVYDKKDNGKIHDYRFCKDIVDCEHYLHEQYDR